MDAQKASTRQDASGDVAGAGWEFAQRIERLGIALGIATSAGPILLAVVPWLVVRITFYRRAAAASRFIDDEADLDLFALRALANQPMPKLAAISDDPVRDWRAGGAISRPAKRVSLLAMAATPVLTWLLGAGAVVLAVQVVVLLGAGYYVATRPEPESGSAGD